MIWLLLFSLGSTQPELRVTPVDRVEINTVTTAPDREFTQVVLWRWSRQLHRFIVAEWQMLDNGWHRERGGIVRWRDCKGRIRRVRPVSFIETRGADSEMADRGLTDTSGRLPYFD